VSCSHTKSKYSRLAVQWLLTCLKRQYLDGVAVKVFTHSGCRVGTWNSKLTFRYYQLFWISGWRNVVANSCGLFEIILSFLLEVLRNITKTLVLGVICSLTIELMVAWIVNRIYHWCRTNYGVYFPVQFSGFTQQCCWRRKLHGMWHCVVGQVAPHPF
jgi:hypothetical protein